MAEQNITCKVHDLYMELGRSPIDFRVRWDDELLGTFKVTKGGVEWWPHSAKKAMKKMNWGKFAKLLEKA